MSPRRPASGMGTRPSSASPAELCDRYIRDMQSMQVSAAKGEVPMSDMDAYSFWELHKLKTQSRCIHRQDEWARRMESKRATGPGSRNDWYVLTGSPRPNLRSQQWLNDDMRSNLGGPPYFPAPELGELRPFSTYKWNSSNGPRSRPQTPQMRTPQGSRPTTPRQTARPSVGFSDQPTLSKADWVERANAMMTDEDKAEMQSAVSTVENQIASRFGKMRDAFKALDVDQSGSISREELQRGLKHWNLAEQSGNEDLIDNLMAACDKDGSGEIDYKEFVDVLSRDKTVGNDPTPALPLALCPSPRPGPSPSPTLYTLTLTLARWATPWRRRTLPRPSRLPLSRRLRPGRPRRDRGKPSSCSRRPCSSPPSPNPNANPTLPLPTPTPTPTPTPDPNYYCYRPPCSSTRRTP